MSPCGAVGSYPTLFTLTSGLHAEPLVLSRRPCAHLLRGGFVSVALSLGLPPVAVSDCRILCCPDFPLAPMCKRSSSELPSYSIANVKQQEEPYSATCRATSASCSFLWASSTLFTTPSERWLLPLRTWVNEIVSNPCINRRILS